MPKAPLNLEPANADAPPRRFEANIELPSVTWLNRELENPPRMAALPNRESLKVELRKAEPRAAKFETARDEEIAEFIAWDEPKADERVPAEKPLEVVALPATEPCAAAPAPNERQPVDIMRDPVAAPRVPGEPANPRIPEALVTRAELPKLCQRPSATAGEPKCAFEREPAPERPAKPFEP